MRIILNERRESTCDALISEGSSFLQSGPIRGEEDAECDGLSSFSLIRGTDASSDRIMISQALLSLIELVGIPVDDYIKSVWSKECGLLIQRSRWYLLRFWAKEKLLTPFPRLHG